MAADRSRGVLVALTDTEWTGDRTQWVELLPTADKVRNGPFYFTLTTEDLETYAAHIRANPDRIPIDYDHDGAKNGSTVAAGWLTGKAEVQGDRLRAEVEWTPQGLDDVKSKRFRFLSGEFDFATKDANTGLMTRARDFIAATLTNRPFFDQLAPVASDIDPEADASNLKETTMTAVIAKSLGLADDATEDQITAAVASLNEKAGKADELETRVAALTAAADSDDDAREQRIAQLEAELAEQKAQRMVERVKEILVTATREGRIVPASHEALTAQFKDNPDGLETIIASMPVRKGLVGVADDGTIADPDVEEHRDAFASRDGSAVVEASDESLTVHARALKILDKSDYTEDEYIAACAKAKQEISKAA